MGYQHLREIEDESDLEIASMSHERESIRDQTMFYGVLPGAYIEGADITSLGLLRTCRQGVA